MLYLSTKITFGVVYIIYYVKSRDTLYDIHLKYGVPIRSIIVANAIDDPNKIYVGQRLVLPDEQDNPFSIEVNKQKRILKLLIDGIIKNTYKIAVGKPSTPTPPGSWNIIKKALWGEQFGGTFLRLNIPWGIYGIHGTNKPWSIGKNVSNGCVRMYSKQARELYEILPINTPVYIY